MSFAVLALTARASAGVAAPVQVRGVDASAYPTVRFTVETATPTSKQPVVREGGTVVSGVEASNLASDTNVVLAIDNSRSMAGASLAGALDAAGAFVDSKPQTDRIGVVSFGHRATALTNSFSTSTIDAQGVLRSIAVDSVQGTALYDAVALAASELDRQDSGGRVIVLLTDGRDVSSRATLAQAVKAARSAGAEVYPIAIEGPDYTPAPLQQLATTTGGEFVAAASGAELRSVYASIASKLAHTWQVQYETTARPGDRSQLAVTVPGEGTAGARLTIPASAGAPPAAAQPSLLPAHVYTSPVATYIVALVAAGLFAFAVLALLAARKASWVRTRLDPHLDASRRRGRRRSPNSGVAITAVLRATERVFGNLRQWGMLRRLLERADVPLRPAEFAWIAVGASCVGAIVVGVASGSAIGAVAGFLAGASVPWLALWFKAKRRLAAFENQLPDLLITLAASLKAGHSFRQGIQTVVEEGQPPAAAEFKRVLTDAQLGRPLEDALLEMAERVGSKNFDFVITAVTIQRQVGGSLAGLFDMVADTVRQRQQFARRIRGLTAMGRMSAYVLIGLPFFLVGAMTLLNGDYMRPLFDTSSGHVMIVLALAMMAVGSLILKKIVSFRG
jgi:tight adherence protein B